MPMSNGNRAGKRRITARFYVNIVIFVLIFGLGLVFQDRYVSLRDRVRTGVVSLAGTVTAAIRSGKLPLRGGDGVIYGANSRPITGAGVQVDESAAESPPTNTGEEYRFDQNLYPYRAMLNQDAQAIYNQVYAHALVGDAKAFTLVKRTTEDVLQTIMCAVYNDHPELFWVDTAYSFGYLGGGDVVTVTLSFNETALNLSASKSKFDEAVSQVIQGAAQYGNNVDKEKYVHDYLMDHAEYDTEADMHQSAYSALVLGRSVCAGYSRAFQHILLEIGIPCYYVTGTAAGGNHAWNIVSVNGGYYNVDASWDDAAGTAGGSRSYVYFNVPDADFTDHLRDDMSARLPACTATEMTYASVYGGDGGGSDQSAVPSPATTYQSLGYGSRDVLTSLSAYNAYCEKQLIRLGPGEHVLTMVLKNQALMDRVCASAEDGSYVSGYAQAAVNALKLQNAEISLKLRGEALADGYILLSQTVTLTGTAATPTPTRPPATPAPTATPSPYRPIPTPVLVTPGPTPEETAVPPTDTAAPPDSPAPSDSSDPGAFMAEPEETPADGG